jgi:hypothetical protein
VKPRKPRRVGDVVQIELAGGRFAYARVLRDASIGVYRELSTESRLPPRGRCDYWFAVGIYDDALAELEVVDHRPSAGPGDDWPPPFRIDDPVTGRTSIYHRGEKRTATIEEVEGLETAAVWELAHIVRRIETELAEGAQAP